ncbi:hypothetical protein Tco_1268012, partial [Tanacetum coccineum]
MIHPETTMITSNNPSRDKMSPRSTIWGQAKRSRVLVIQMLLILRRAMRQLPREMVVLSVVYQ